MQPTEHQLVLLALISGGFAITGVVLGALIAGLYSLRAKRNEYVNDYYKKVIDRRIAAYEQMENLIVPLRTVIPDDDKKPYHFLFTLDELGIHQILYGITSQALWLSEKAFQKTRELSLLLFSKRSEGMVELGKQNYAALAQLREDLEEILATDMLDLHNVERFLKKKRNKT